MQLRMVPMIDVVFLLLVFFLLAANFRSREGFLPAELPRQVVRNVSMELEPLTLALESQADGSCVVRIGDEPSFRVLAGEAGGFAQLTDRLAEVLGRQGRTADDPVKLMPSRFTRWDDVVKAYDAIWRLDLRNIIFAMAE